MMFGIEKLEWCDYPTVNNVEARFTRFDRIHKRDRQQDKRTDGGTDTTRQHSIARQKIGAKANTIH